MQVGYVSCLHRIMYEELQEEKKKRSNQKSMEHLEDEIEDNS